MLRSLFAMTALLIATTAASAQAPQQTPLGTFNDWTAYSASLPNGKVCFVISQPKSRAPEGLRRDPAYFFITHRPGDKVRNEISMQAGFPQQGTADVTVGSANFRLFTEGERAWSDGQNDQQMVGAMRGGASMIVKSTSSRGNVTTDTYSLSGISAAMDRINQECP
ncbi:invasion associated locus B family protein [Agaricicola taiwanensis]|uniref:invasion associated locus B family protein n=1 Tax=Agaricicola taiwanensis TaxID=591372 RepID=UPI001E4CC10E|nr:invasion associated locus B family protein [Agaricicola taiwanensis]